MNADFRIIPAAGIAKTQIWAPPGVADGAFIRIDFQAQFTGNIAGNTFHHPFGSPFAANVDNTI